MKDGDYKKVNSNKKKNISFRIIKTVKPDVYELYIHNEQKTSITKHSYASIPNIKTSKWVKELIENKDECYVECYYNPIFNKWTPLKESSYACKILSNYNSSYQMKRIKRYTDWQSMPYKEKSQYDEFQKIIAMANQSGIPKIIIDDAIRYHKKISEERTFRGLNRDGIISASIYISCRINNNPRTAKEIATIFNLDNTSATKGCKNAVSIINQLETDMENNEKTQFCKTKPISFIERYCSRLQINNDLTKLCQFIALCIEKKNLIPENTPHSIAAGIIYFITQTFHLNISKKDIHIISEISEVTINKCYKKLDNMKNELIPKKIMDKYNK